MGSPEEVLASSRGGNPPSHIYLSLLSVLLFLPTGLAAVVCSVVSIRKASLGDRIGASKASFAARMLFFASEILFIASVVLAVLGVVRA